MCGGNFATMQILLASATTIEIKPTIEWLDGRGAILITGIGSTASSYALTKYILQYKPDMIIQAGIGGSFSTKYPPGSVVLINEEVIADMGAIEDGKLIDTFDMGFAPAEEKPYAGKMLPNPNNNSYGLDGVRGATVNAISSTASQVSMIKEKYQPVIESMEGAALHYVCLMENIPFLQLRAVSNFAGERNKANWKFKEAINNLNETLKTIISTLLTERT